VPVVTLTDKFIQGAKCPAGKKQIEWFDGAVPGHSLIVSAAAKVFYAHYTDPGSGKRARVKIGGYPDISLSKSREKARGVRAAVSEGRDPTDRRGAMSVADLVENYIARHAANQRSGDEIARRLRKNVTGVIGKTKLSALHRRDLTRCIDALITRDAPVEANRVIEDMRAMVRWARGRGDLDENLMEGMKAPAEKAERDRVLSQDEIRTFWHGLGDAEMDAGTARLLKLILATMARPGEVAGMVAEELDLEKRIWTIPPERSKNKREHILPLSDLAAGLSKSSFLKCERRPRGGKTAWIANSRGWWGARRSNHRGCWNGCSPAPEPERPSLRASRQSDQAQCQTFRYRGVPATRSAPHRGNQVRGNQHLAIHRGAPAGSCQRHQSGHHVTHLCAL
jgi:integrase